MLQIAGDAAFVAVDREVVGGYAFYRGRRPFACLIARAGHLDLHDVGAVVGEHQRAVRTCERAREIDNANSLKRATLAADHRGPALTDRQSTVEA